MRTPEEPGKLTNDLLVLVSSDVRPEGYKS